MKLFGAESNAGMIRKISDWFGMNFNPKLSPGCLKVERTNQYTPERKTRHCRSTHVSHKGSTTNFCILFEKKTKVNSK